MKPDIRKILSTAVLLGLLLVSIQDLWAADIEVGGGYTFNRHETLHNAGLVNLNLVTQTDSRFPTEWSLGYIFGQDKNPEYLNNDDPTAWLGIGKRFRWKNVIFGFGLVAVDRTSQRISSNLNFKSQFGVQFGPLVTAVQHISNASLHGDNDGESFFTVSYRFSAGH